MLKSLAERLLGTQTTLKELFEGKYGIVLSRLFHKFKQLKRSVFVNFFD